MTPFEQAWNSTGRAEGGYVNNPDDKGGETNHGITVKVARANGYAGPMKDLTKEQAIVIAKKAYWDIIRLDDIAHISTPVALEMFDTGFNMGPNWPVKFIQRALNLFNYKETFYGDIDADGDIGPKTVSSLLAFIAKRGADGEQVLLKTLNVLQAERFIQIAEADKSQETFVYGWIKERVKL